MKRNDYIDVICTYMANDGKGVCKLDNACVYVDNFLPDEKANVIIEKVKGSTYYGRIQSLDIVSRDRAEVECEKFGKCGGCNLLHFNYVKQLEFKQNIVIQAFKNKGLRVKVHKTEGMIYPYNYRNKVIASLSMRKNKVIYGMYEESSHEVVYAKECLIQNKKLNVILQSIKQTMDELKIKTEEFDGVVRHVLLRIGVVTNEVLVVFVTNDEIFPGRNELVKRLVAKHKEIKTIIQNTNTRDTSVVLGDKERVLYGPGFIYDELLGNRYKISAKSFYQINHGQTSKLYEKAIELANAKPTDVVMDAYCGIGTIGLSIANKVKKVIGVEINSDAIKDAINNTKINNIKNARFYCDDVKRFMREFDEHIDILIIDPPRSGCDKEFIDSVKKLKPNKIVYVSCNPITQADDIFNLTDIYEVKEAYPVDMFPHTVHVECVTLLSLKSAK